MQRILNIFNKEFSNINQAAFLLGLFALLAQILGLFRDKSLAHFVGVGSGLDIYYASFRIPDFIFVSVASLFAVVALLPFLTEKIGKNENGGLNHTSIKAQIFFSQVFTIFMILMVLVSILFFFLMPILVPLIFSGFEGETLTKTIELSRIMLLSPILLGLSNLAGSVTQLFRKFFVFALSPVFYNLGIIIGVIFFYPIWGLPGLIWGVVLGGFMHFAIQLPVIIRHGFIPKLIFKINWHDIKKLFIVSLPRTAGLALYNITILVLVSLTSLINEGSISVFNLSLNIYAVPISIIGVSYSVAVFPTLSRFFSSNDTKQFIDHLISAMRQIIFWSLPILFLFIVLRAQIVRVILGSGKFSWDDTRLVAAMLAVFSLSILAQSLNTLIVRAFYAMSRTWRPFLMNLISSVLIIGLAELFLHLFNVYLPFKYFIQSILRVGNLTGTSILMIGLAFSIGLIINFFLLWFYFKKDFGVNVPRQSISPTFFQSLTAAFFVGLVAYVFLGIFDKLFDINTFFGILMQGFLSGIAGVLSGVIVLKLLKNQEIKELENVLKAKFWKTKVIAPSQEDL